jgi:hypothetical protein
MHCQ